MTDLTNLAASIHAANRAKGFYDQEGERNFGEIIALIHAEASEALEAHRDNKFTQERIEEVLATTDLEDFRKLFLATVKDTVEDEIADTIIRLLDLCGYKGIDIQSHIEAKLRYNATRPAKHGKEY